MLQELGVFPQGTISTAQGLVGVRRWSLDHGDNLETALNDICDSHWPGKPDCLPVQVQWGEFFAGCNMRRPPSKPDRYYNTIGELPEYGKYLIVAQYALHRMSNCWPAKIPKPWHPPGTTLTLKIRGGGQYLTVTVAGMQPVIKPIGPYAAMNEGFVARVIVPVAEYHVICDRMTLLQVNTALAQGPLDNPSRWDILNGSANHDEFLGSPKGTLLMDGYEIDDSFVCDYFTPNRYRMSACFKRRIITNDDGTVAYLGTGAERMAIGWNHDFLNRAHDEGPDKQWGWQIIKLKAGPHGQFRYSYMRFADIFGNLGPQPCGGPGSDGAVLNDSAFCDQPNPSESSLVIPSVGSFGGGSDDPNDTASNDPPASQNPVA